VVAEYTRLAAAFFAPPKAALVNAVLDRVAKEG
jgi:transcription termination factor NusB